MPRSFTGAPDAALPALYGPCPVLRPVCSLNALVLVTLTVDGLYGRAEPYMVAKTLDIEVIEASDYETGWKIGAVIRVCVAVSRLFPSCLWKQS